MLGFNCALPPAGISGFGLGALPRTPKKQVKRIGKRAVSFQRPEDGKAIDGMMSVAKPVAVSLRSAIAQIRSAKTPQQKMAALRNGTAVLQKARSVVSRATPMSQAKLPKRPVARKLRGMGCFDPNTGYDDGSPCPTPNPGGGYPQFPGGDTGLVPGYGPPPAPSAIPEKWCKKHPLQCQLLQMSQDTQQQMMWVLQTLMGLITELFTLIQQTTAQIGQGQQQYPYGDGYPGGYPGGGYPGGGYPSGVPFPDPFGGVYPGNISPMVPYGGGVPGDPYGDVQPIPAGYGDTDVFGGGAGDQGIPSDITTVYPGPVGRAVSAQQAPPGPSLIESGSIPTGVIESEDGFGGGNPPVPAFERASMPALPPPQQSQVIQPDVSNPMEDTSAGSDMEF